MIMAVLIHSLGHSSRHDPAVPISAAAVNGVKEMKLHHFHMARSVRYSRSSMRGPGRQLAIVLALILAVGVFYIATIREGHLWGDDFAMYIHHAKNLAYGNAYADTGYIYNPHYPDLGPRAYPPLFPLVLAPVYKIMGLELGAMKVLDILLFLVFLFLLYLLFRPELPFGYLLAILTVLALNPYIWALKDQVISEFLFLLLMVVTFHAV